MIKVSYQQHESTRLLHLPDIVFYNELIIRIYRLHTKSIILVIFRLS